MAACLPIRSPQCLPGHEFYGSNVKNQYDHDDCYQIALTLKEPLLTMIHPTPLWLTPPLPTTPGPIPQHPTMTCFTTWPWPTPLHHNPPRPQYDPSLHDPPHPTSPLPDPNMTHHTLPWPIPPRNSYGHRSALFHEVDHRVSLSVDN